MDIFETSDQTFSAPQFVRSRQRYRGVRESQKMQLEAAQFYYDVCRILERLKNARAALEDSISHFDTEIEDVPTNTLPAGAGNDSFPGEDVYPTDAIMTDNIPGFDLIAAQLEELDKRITALES